MAVCDKTFHIYSRLPYADDIPPIEPYESISLEEAKSFDCHRPGVRDPRETKGQLYHVTDLSGATGCDPEGNCC